MLLDQLGRFRSVAGAVLLAPGLSSMGWPRLLRSVDFPLRLLFGFEPVTRSIDGKELLPTTTITSTIT